MNTITFNRLVFQRTFGTYIIATLIWLGLIAIPQMAKGVGESILVWVYFLILPCSLIRGMREFRWEMLGLIPVAAVLFLFNTFVLGFIYTYTNSILLYGIIVSPLTAIVFTRFINRWHHVPFRWQTIMGTAAGMMVGYVIIERFNFLIGYGTLDFAIPLIVFHTLIFLPLALGMAIAKRQEEPEYEPYE